MKYVIVTGGVISGLGKGVTTSSIGKILQARNIKVTAIKIDPYLNYDAGTMNPYQHGEVYVLEDGGEVDLDLGNYERFLDVYETKDHNITTGKVYQSVIEKERRGDYLGKTVQIIPHITDEIKRRIKDVAKKCDVNVVLIEVGGTVGDIESMPFLEALRELGREVGEQNRLFVHTTLIPSLQAVGEQKTKPTQHSVKELRAIGIQPDIIVGRTEEPLTVETKTKISDFCDVPVEAVISAVNVKNVYELPLVFEKQNLGNYILKKLNMTNGEPDFEQWKSFLKNLEKPKGEVVIGIVGKYVHLKDSYISHREAFVHASADLNVDIKLKWIDAENIEKGKESLERLDGIIIPGGFGARGVEGKIMAARYARENKVPFLGICLGFQIAVIEFSRSVLGLKDAHSTEFNPNTKNPVIDLLPEQVGLKNLGGTMRLGAQKVKIEDGSIAIKLYQRSEIYERHRHRYEVNPVYVENLEKHGMIFSAKDDEGIRMEILELKDHPFFMASQFHPEFKSRPLAPSVLHTALVMYSYKSKNSR